MPDEHRLDHACRSVAGVFASRSPQGRARFIYPPQGTLSLRLLRAMTVMADDRLLRIPLLQDQARLPQS